jgi:hypothetical protein
MSRRYNRKECSLPEQMNKSVDFGRGKGLDTGAEGKKVKYDGRKSTDIQEESKGQSVYSNMNFKTKSNVHMIRREVKNGEEKGRESNERGLVRERSGKRETDRRNNKRGEIKDTNRIIGGYEMKLRRPVEIKYFRTLSLPHIDMLRVDEITQVSVLGCIHKPTIKIITDYKQAPPHGTRLAKSSLHKLSPRTIPISNKRIPKEISPKISPIARKVQSIPKLVPTIRSKSVLNNSKPISPSSQIASKPKEPLYRKSTNHPINTTYRHSSVLVGQRKNTPLKQTVISSISICEIPRELKKSSAEMVEIKANKVEKVDMSVQTENDIHKFNFNILEDPDEDKVSPFLVEKGREENISTKENLRQEERNNEISIGDLDTEIEEDKKCLKEKRESSIPEIATQQAEKINSSTGNSCVDTKLEDILSFEEFMKITPSSPCKESSYRFSLPDITALSPKSTTGYTRHSYLESPLDTLKSQLSCYSGSSLKTSEIKIEYETRTQKLQKRNLAAIKIQRKYRIWRLSRYSSKQAKKPQLALGTIKYLNQSLTNIILQNKLLQAFRIWKLTVDILKAEVYKKFLSLCATFIQKNWRGYLARKLLKNKVASRIHLQTCLRRFVKGWKVRQIMKSSTVSKLREQIRDSESLIADLKNSNPTQVSLDLIQKMSVQVKAMKRNLREEVRYLYDLGSWNPIKEMRSKKVVTKRTRFQIDQFNEKASNLKEESECESPKIRFSNFLRRNKENYDPLKSIRNSSRSQTPQPSFKFEERLTLNHDKSLEEQSEYEPKPERKSFNFLKRKSQMIKPTKINWRSNSKIDCWGSPRSKSNRRSYTHTQSLLIDNRENSRLNSEAKNPFPLCNSQELSNVPDSPSNRFKSSSFEEIEKQCNLTVEVAKS